MLALLLSSLLTLVQLNCENLFDCRHDTLKNDFDFTPSGRYEWTVGKYFNHLNNTARTILACSSSEDGIRLPDIVTLCEVENDSVMTDLTRRSMLRNTGYDYVMTQSADSRGIDVALLYSTFTIQMLDHHSVRVSPEPNQKATRDILYTKCLFMAADTLHIIALHAPSRRGGRTSSERYRMRVVDAVALIADSVRANCHDANILIAGDFNDYDNSPMLIRLIDHGLCHISRGAKGINGATSTYVFRQHWGSLDHIFATEGMATRLIDCQIGDFSFLVTSGDMPSQRKPERSFRGPIYKHGYSDHLPLIARFRMDSGF